MGRGARAVLAVALILVVCNPFPVVRVLYVYDMPSRIITTRWDGFYTTGFLRIHPQGARLASRNPPLQALYDYNPSNLPTSFCAQPRRRSRACRRCDARAYATSPINARTSTSPVDLQCGITLEPWAPGHLRNAALARGHHRARRTICATQASYVAINDAHLRRPPLRRRRGPRRRSSQVQTAGARTSKVSRITTRVAIQKHEGRGVTKAQIY